MSDPPGPADMAYPSSEALVNEVEKLQHLTHHGNMDRPAVRDADGSTEDP